MNEPKGTNGETLSAETIGAANALDSALGMMCDGFAEVAASLPNQSDAFRLLRLVDATRAHAASITQSLRTHAQRSSRVVDHVEEESVSSVRNGEDNDEWLCP